MIFTVNFLLNNCIENFLVLQVIRTYQLNSQNILLLFKKKKIYFKKNNLNNYIVKHYMHYFFE